MFLAAEIFVFAVSPLGLLTNALFVFFVVRIKSMRTPFNIILCNLSVAGVLFLILAVFYTHFGARDEPLKRVFCFLFAICYVASGLFVILVASERLLATFTQFSSICQDSNGRLAAVCAGCWLVALACGGLIKLCVLVFFDSPYTLMIIVLVLSALFLVVDIILYGCTIWRLCKRPLVSPTLQRRVVIKLAITTLIVSIFDSTHAVQIIVHYFAEGRLDRTPFEMFLLAISSVSATINPIVYGFFSFDLKKFSARKIFCECCANKRGSNGYSNGQGTSDIKL